VFLKIFNIHLLVKDGIVGFGLESENVFVTKCSYVIECGIEFCFYGCVKVHVIYMPSNSIKD
jgi:hypothetical protein